MSGVPCKFFLEGRCRFGTACRNLHSKSGSSTGFGGAAWSSPRSSAFSTPNRFNTPQQRAPAGDRSAMNANEIIDTIGREMDDWEKSHMWPFSCYSYIKDAPCIQGLQDYSPDELRFEAYKAKKGNKIPDFQKNFAQLVQSFQKKRLELKQPTVQTRQALTADIEAFKQRMSSKPGSVSVGKSFGSGAAFGAASTTFGGSTGVGQASVFGASASTNPFQPQNSTTAFSAPASGNSFGSSAFGAPASGSTAFGAGSTAFGAATTSQVGNTLTKSAFGTSGTTAPSFGTPAFGTPASTGTAFGQPTASVFGGSSAFGQPASTNSSFGNTTFGGVVNVSSAQTNASSAFGSSTTTANSNPFGAQNTGSAPTASSSVFGSPASNSTNSFGSQMPTSNTNPFGGSTTSQQASNPFGGSTSGSAFGTSNSSASLVEDRCYTPADKLTTEELAAFRAAEFEMGKIPLNPPPRELCT